MQDAQAIHLDCGLVMFMTFSSLVTRGTLWVGVTVVRVLLASQHTQQPK
jgi:hypothetical protein